jgi:hypothetical protein
MKHTSRTKQTRPTVKPEQPSRGRPWRPEDGVLFADHLLLTPRQTAKWLDTTEGFLAVMRSKKRGPCFVRIGRKIMYEKSAVLSYLAARRVETDAAPAA